MSAGDEAEEEADLGGVYMRKLSPARVSHWDDFLILYRVYMMTHAFCLVNKARVLFLHCNSQFSHKKILIFQHKAFVSNSIHIKEMLYAVRCLKSNEDMILALAGQFKQLSHEPEKFR